jgi:hypothetical protein
MKLLTFPSPETVEKDRERRDRALRIFKARRIIQQAILQAAKGDSERLVDELVDYTFKAAWGSK